jgi:hypothetical protein
MLLEAETNKYCPGGNDFGAISNLITWVLNFSLSVYLVQLSSTGENLHNIRIGPVHKMIEVLDEDALDEVHVVDCENRLAQQEPAVVVMALDPPVVIQHQISHVLLAKEELLYGGSMRHHCTLCTFTVLISSEAEFMNVQFSLRFLGIILKVLRLEDSVWIS